MALSPLPAFTPDASIGTSAVSGGVTVVALPGTPASDTTVIITNLGNAPCAFKLGTSNAVTVTPSTGMVVLAGESAAIGIGANTFIALIGIGGNASINLTTGN